MGYWFLFDIYLSIIANYILTNSPLVPTL
jgi:hypothetical protein